MVGRAAKASRDKRKRTVDSDVKYITEISDSTPPVY
jgi:hypothetical protein